MGSVLNLTTVMRPNRFLLWVWIIISLSTVQLVQAQSIEGVVISAPVDGDVLQGVVTISGTVQIDGFERGEVEFAYSGETASSGWFLIGELNQAVANGPLAAWDTTTITDGSYDLRVIAYAQSKDPAIIIVRRLRVRNYTQVETATPTIKPTLNLKATQSLATPEISGSSIEPTRTITPTLKPTSLPTNPAQLKPEEIIGGFGIGLLSAAGLIAFIGLYLGLRTRKR